MFLKKYSEMIDSSCQDAMNPQVCARESEPKNTFHGERSSVRRKRIFWVKAAKRDVIDHVTEEEENGIH